MSLTGTGSVSPGGTRQTVVDAARRYLKDATEVQARRLGSAALPEETERASVLEPAGEGRWSGTELTRIRRATRHLARDASSLPECRDVVQELREAIDAHLAARGLPEPAIHDAVAHYAVPLLAVYLEQVGSLTYDDTNARRAIERMLEAIEAPEDSVRALVVLEGFSAAKPCELEPGAQLRLIDQDDLFELGGESPVRVFGIADAHTPRTDWWVCDATMRGKWGTPEAWNAAHPFAQLLASALAVFKAGGALVRLALVRGRGPFGPRMRVSGGEPTRLSLTGGPYTLSDEEILEFVAFWKKYQALMAAPHYLQLPARRLLSAGGRRRTDDALVDYVIGLEALLGKPDERTELGYRFRVRGSVVLAATRSERRQQAKALEKLYDLRSKVVHGLRVDDAALESALPVAEKALRRVWRWYFDHYHGSTTNSAGVNHIDQDLLGP